MIKKILFLLLLLFISSCSVSNTSGGRGDITGTEGMVMSINQYPKELYVNQNAAIPITLENRGFSDITDGILTISTASNSKYISFSNNRFDGIKLTGKGLLLPVGERIVKSFQMDSVRLPDAKEVVETLRATACFTYKTQASPIVCINPAAEYGEQALTQGCSYKTAKLESSQGGPVAITNVVTSYIGNSVVAFTISIDDVFDKGNIVSTQSYSKFCGRPELVTSNDINIVGIDAYLGGEKIDCFSAERLQETEGISSIKLSSSGPDVICKTVIPEDEINAPGYTTPLNIYLTYGYAYNEVFSIKIKNPAYGK